MSNALLHEIAEHFRREDPEDAGFYTEEWAQRECADLNMSPEEYLAYLDNCTARSVAAADITEDQPWTKGLPEHVKDKLSGPVDALSYELMAKQ